MPQRRGSPPRVSDLVLVADSTLSRNIWFGRISAAVYPEPDKIVLVDVRTRGGLLRRLTKKLTILPTRLTHKIVHRHDSNAASKVTLHGGSTFATKTFLHYSSTAPSLQSTVLYGIRVGISEVKLSTSTEP
ncbi:hypothetical protein EVAR_50410_1 [Eumeta japonica]|uniref:DUF5641 domain-containing protein n=1 Tax=Eumeta variegata TaxID=151549 RepID=A0A4C1WTV9_EUMVA|nr:hypothetical protein EVAR_50410_1 [Eumeta japonica]